MRDLSSTSKIVEELLTVIFCDDLFQFHGFVWRQLQIVEITDQHGGFVSLPRIHNKSQCSDKPEAVVEVVVDQSSVFGGDRDMWKRARLETL